MKTTKPAKFTRRDSEEFTDLSRHIAFAAVAGFPPNETDVARFKELHNKRAAFFDTELCFPEVAAK